MYLFQVILPAQKCEIADISKLRILKLFWKDCKNWNHCKKWLTAQFRDFTDISKFKNLKTFSRTVRIKSAHKREGAFLALGQKMRPKRRNLKFTLIF